MDYFKKVSAFPVYDVFAFNIETVQDKSCLDNNFYAVKTVFLLTPGYFFRAPDNFQEPFLLALGKLKIALNAVL